MFSAYVITWSVHIFSIGTTILATWAPKKTCVEGGEGYVCYTDLYYSEKIKMDHY